jgi:hypothetical protein
MGSIQVFVILCNAIIRFCHLWLSVFLHFQLIVTSDSLARGLSLNPGLDADGLRWLFQHVAFSIGVQRAFIDSVKSEK